MGVCVCECEHPLHLSVKQGQIHHCEHIDGSVSLHRDAAFSLAIIHLTAPSEFKYLEFMI